MQVEARFVEQLVLVGRMSGSSELFAGRLSTAITLLMPASASVNASDLDLVWVDWVELEVE